jgi:hypothetical protein
VDTAEVADGRYEFSLTKVPVRLSAPVGMSPGVLPHQTRRITDVKIDGKTHTLYVAPTKAGGFCYLWSHLMGGCQASRTGGFAKRISGGGEGGLYGMTVLNGTFLLANGARVEVTHADGTTSNVPFVWVTKPINAGFYLYAVPAAHRRAGHQVVSVALLDSHGHVLTRARQPGATGIPAVEHSAPGFPHLGVPPQAIYADRQQLFDIRADNGSRQGLWIAPERGGGTCYWTNRGSGCTEVRGRLPKIAPDFFKGHPDRLREKAVLGLGFEGGNPTVICCQVTANVARVELRYQDGDRAELTPKKTFLLIVIPSSHYALGHRVKEIVAYDAAGKMIGERSIGNQAGVYPCAKAQEKKLGYGVTECP